MAKVDFAALYLEAGIAKWRKHLRLRIIDEQIPVGEEEDSRTAAGYSSAVPESRPKFPCDVKRDGGFSGPGGESQKCPQRPG